MSALALFVLSCLLALVGAFLLFIDCFAAAADRWSDEAVLRRARRHRRARQRNF